MSSIYRKHTFDLLSRRQMHERGVGEIEALIDVFREDFPDSGNVVLRQRQNLQGAGFDRTKQFVDCNFVSMLQQYAASAITGQQVSKEAGSSFAAATQVLWCWSPSLSRAISGPVSTSTRLLATVAKAFEIFRIRTQIQRRIFDAAN